MKVEGWSGAVALLSVLAPASTCPPLRHFRAKGMAVPFGRRHVVRNSRS
jgi:hypothetical protein